MITQPDLLVRDVLTQAFEQVRMNPTEVIDDVFTDRPPDEREQFKSYFIDRMPEVLLGYARETPSLPALFIVVGDAGESNQPLGSLIENDESGEVVIERNGVFFQSTTVISCLAPNATGTIAVQAVAAYALLGARDHLWRQGLYEQSMGISDFQPVDPYIPDNVFRRDIRLQSKYLATFSAVFPKLREVTVTAQAYSPFARVTVSSRS